MILGKQKEPYDSINPKTLDTKWKILISNSKGVSKQEKYQLGCFFFWLPFIWVQVVKFTMKRKMIFFFVFGQRNFYSTQEVILKKKHFLKKTNAQRLPNNEL